MIEPYTKSGASANISDVRMRSKKIPQISSKEKMKHQLLYHFVHPNLVPANTIWDVPIKLGHTLIGKHSPTHFFSLPSHFPEKIVPKPFVATKLAEELND